MTNAIDFSPADLAIVQEIIAVWLPPCVRIWVFGSRAAGTARRYSDLDLALEGPKPLEFALLAQLTEALSESDLTIRVDIVDLRAVDPEFRRLIADSMTDLPRRGGFLLDTAQVGSQKPLSE